MANKVPVPKGADVAGTKYQQYYQANNVGYGNQLRWVDDPGRSDPSKGRFMRLADWERMQRDQENRPGAYEALANPTPATPAATPTSGGNGTGLLPATNTTLVNYGVPMPMSSLPSYLPGTSGGKPLQPSPNSDPTDLSNLHGGIGPQAGGTGAALTGPRGRTWPGVDNVSGRGRNWQGGDYQQGVKNPPSWWLSTAYSNPNEQQAFANAANAILPSLSPEDQRTLATYLATNFKDAYGTYADAKFAPIPTQLTGERNQYLDPTRVQNVTNILTRMQAAAGGKSLGVGFDYLKNALNLMNQYNTPGMPMTREQYAQFQNGMKALNASMGSDVSAYKNLATMFNMPGFTAGNLVNNDANKRFNA